MLNIAHLVSAYYIIDPDLSVPAQRVAFGTSGHRGTALNGSFNQAHILAIAQAITEYRQSQNITGPLFLGKDSHALSEPAYDSVVSVLLANGVDVVAEVSGGYTPTPVISHAIIGYNKGREGGWADGILLTPSHNPPEDGGLKYNPPHGGPADSDVTGWIEQRANQWIAQGVDQIKRRTGQPGFNDFVTPYVQDLPQILDMAAISRSGLRLGIDPMGGAALDYWAAIIDRFNLNADLVNPRIDSTFDFMPRDWDGRIRMDCSSPFAMAGLLALKDKFDLSFGNDTDADRHGIVSGGAGLMNPNHFLGAAIDYLFKHRPWPGAKIGKTAVSSALIDRIGADLGVQVIETPVGFKWFVNGLAHGEFGFAGEESAGASFLRRDGRVWTTDKDGIILCLLAAELTAISGKLPSDAYQDITARLGTAFYARIDTPASPKQKSILKGLGADNFAPSHVAGDKVTAVLSHAPGNGAALGGIKVITDQGWFAARPSGTENVYKIYAESFVSAEHLAQIQADAKQELDRVFDKLA
jgi:phosphoglucomutase